MPGAEGREEWGVTVTVHEVFLWDDENILKMTMVVMMPQIVNILKTTQMCLLNG